MSAMQPATADNEAKPADPDDLRSVRAEIRALIERWRSEGRFIPRSDSWLRSFDIEFSRDLARAGFLGMTWPRRFGGRGSTNSARLVVTEELLRAGAPVAAHWIADRQIGPAILRHGSPQLQDEILPGIVSADYLFCLGMSEPEAGSDLASVRTSAKRTDDGWRVSGRKVWTSIAHRATHAYLLARTEKCERKYDGLTEFIVDMNSAGITVTPIVDLAGEHHFNEVVFDDVFVPEHRVLGKVGDGWRQVVEQLSFERGGPERLLSTYPLLIALLAEVADSADVHMTQTIGTLSARLAVLRQMSRDVARAVDHGAAPVQEAATLKMLGNQFERDVIEAARPLLGREGSAPHSVFGEALLASPGFTLRGGAADVLLSVIAKQELRA
ncbi:acyl-CoA dehydrogenase family protein [Nocardia neocaledoniensis]|uniref:acyl-CoA dehydrogenase family protein n=1 Tax=Nocardia neocaledoniensis TaxID=236511 RepID=UPI0024564E9B|nr:acyl-CoA dehydrogenase family protein [Nocardia neocaledoniensis]